MPKLLLTPTARLGLILFAGLGGLALKIFSPLTMQTAVTILGLTAITGVPLLILFLDMANWGYSSIKLGRYPPLGLNYVPSFGLTKAYAGKGAVLWGAVTLILGLVLFTAVAAVLVSFGVNLAER